MKQTRIAAGLSLAVLFLSAVAFAQSDLGTIQFPNSGSKAAQEAFLRGVKALHNFWFEEATDAFLEAQKLDPSFALAYWGEAMSYNHPLWAEQDIASARKALAKLGATRKERLEKAPTAREKAYLEAVEILFGEGDKLPRDLAYSQAMERVFRASPDDNEAACFYALSLLGTVRPGDRGFRRQMLSASVLEKIYAANPAHPGAAHYLIHSFDDPEHAPLGLDAADRYAQIAPSAHHALHMPSHIFLQLGMWDRVAASNKASFEASEAWVKRRNLAETKKDFHSLEWRQYALLQLGRFREAKATIEPARLVADATGDSRVKGDYARMQARLTIETREWQKVPLPATGGSDPRYSSAGVLLAAGMSAARTSDPALAESARAQLQALREADEAAGRAYQAKPAAVMEKELAGLIRLGEGKVDAALALLKEAASIEETMDPPSGPANPLKPAQELYGEVLLEQGRAQDAREQFEKALLRMPNRSSSLLGLARAASRMRDRETAGRRYAEFLTIWHGADADRPELAEARGFLPTTDGSK